MSITPQEAANRGHSFIWEQRWQEAIKAFQYAISHQSGEPSYYDGLATAYRNIDDLDKALENYQMAARLSNGEAIYLEQVAQVQELLGQRENAAKTFHQIGEIRLRDRRIADAVEKWEKAVSLNPALLIARQRLANAYRNQNQIPQAAREYMKIAQLYEEQKNPSNALAACKQALELTPRDKDILTAIEKLQHGEKAFSDMPRLTGGVRNTRPLNQPEESQKKIVVPVVDAQRLARSKIAEDLFNSGGDIKLATKALDYQTRGMLDEAINAYEQVIRSGMSSNAAHFNLGLLYQEKLRYAEAVKQFEIAVRDPDYRLASHFALGESHRALGRIDLAIEHFIKALTIVDLPTVKREQAGRLTELYENLADSLMAKGEQDKAVAFSNALIDFLSKKGWENEVKDARKRLDAMSGGAGTMILGDILTAGSSTVLEALYRAQEYTKRNLINTAMEEVYRAIDISPNYLPAHMQMADLLVRQQRVTAATEKFLVLARIFQVRNDPRGAMHAYERAVNASPMNIQLRMDYIEMLKQSGQTEKAIEQYIGMGQSYYQLAQVDRAREVYMEGLRLAPRGTNPHWRIQLLRHIGDIEVQLLDWKRAVPIYSELRRLDPEDERATIMMIDLLYKVGQGDQALQELDRYLMHLIKSGRGAKVFGILEDMVQRRPTDPDLTDRLVNLYMRQKKPQKAVEILDRLGNAQFDANQTAAGVVTLKKILSLNPPNRKDYEQLLQQLSGK